MISIGTICRKLKVINKRVFDFFLGGILVLLFKDYI